MPAAQPPRGPSRQALLAEVQALRQRVAALEQEKHDLEVMLEMATDHADDLSETLQQERHDLATMLEITTDHGDINSEALWQERDDLETMLEMTTDHADALEADLQSQAEALARRSQFIRETFGRYVSEDVVAQLLDAPEGFELGGALAQGDHFDVGLAWLYGPRRAPRPPGGHGLCQSLSGGDGRRHSRLPGHDY